MENEKNWYIYLHLKKDTKEPFYVGKGKDRRALVKRCRSFHWNNIVKKHGYEVMYLEHGLTEQEANDKEIQWIKTYGRQDTGTGVLVNFTNGGEGSSGRPMNERTKKAISEHNRMRPTSENQKRAVGSMFRGKFGSDHNRSKSVMCVETGEIFGSMSEAERKLNIGGGGVCWSIKNSKPIFGMHFEAAK